MVSRSRRWANAHPLRLFSVLGVLSVLAGAASYSLWPATSGAASVLGEKVVNPAAAAASPDFTLSVTPASKTVAVGTPAKYTVTLTPLNKYKGTVTLSASVPSGANVTTSFSQSTVNSTTKTSTLTVSTTNANPGDWTITVSGTDGSLTHASTTELIISLPKKFDLDVTPASIKLLPGSIALYSVKLTRSAGYTAAVSLTVTDLPDATTATFSPGSPITGSSSKLQVTTTPSTPAGTYKLRVSASATGVATQTDTVSLVVTDQGQPFIITGSPTGELSPGGPALPIELTLKNPNDQSIRISNITVQVVGTSAGSDCDSSNFAVQQFTGSYPLTIGANKAKSFRQLSVAKTSWPSVRMVETGLNQDACKDVQVSLAYSGFGEG
jgi:hypothetical protein